MPLRLVVVVRLLCYTVLVRGRSCATGVILLMVVRDQVLTVMRKAVAAVGRVLVRFTVFRCGVTGIRIVCVA